jgi:membrane-associated phospholipid phosphatase
VRKKASARGLTATPQHGMERPMLFWLGLLLLAAGCLSFAVDRRAAHFFHDEIHQRWAALIHRTTDWAKGSHWIQISVVVFAGSWLIQRFAGANAYLALAERTSLVFLICLAAASIILHSIKIVLGRRRPRDELEHGLYGWRPFGFDLSYDSFPSGHALTIFCVAVILAGALPAFTILWFAIAIYLALTRVFLNSHYLSDVFVGAAIAILTTREILIIWFPAQAQGWF